VTQWDIPHSRKEQPKPFFKDVDGQGVKP
jgi:hypothetical protein